jgi:dihydrofolate reductase
VNKVFANIALSFDGYMTPEGMTMEHWDDPGFKDWGAKWGALMSWLIGLEHFRSSLKIGPGGATGPVNDMVRHTSERIGANIMGRRMFEAGERGWPEEAPFHTPVFVLTHNTRVSRGCDRAGRRSISSRRVRKSWGRRGARCPPPVSSGGYPEVDFEGGR